MELDLLPYSSGCLLFLRFMLDRLKQKSTMYTCLMEDCTCLQPLWYLLCMPPHTALRADISSCSLTMVL